jgi:hypothetical protein
MWAHLERLTHDIHILRVFGDGHRYGEPWLWGCVVQGSELKLVQNAPTPEMWRVIGNAMHEQFGADTFWYDRGDGRRTIVRMNENGSFHLEKTE